jgi:hypothetical protein
MDTTPIPTLLVLASIAWTALTVITVRDLRKRK